MTVDEIKDLAEWGRAQGAVAIKVGEVEFTFLTARQALLVNGAERDMAAVANEPKPELNQLEKYIQTRWGASAEELLAGR